MCQLNPTVGDLPGNVTTILKALGDARTHGADLAVFTELVITGYPPEDLLLKPGFVEAARSALDQVIAATTESAAVVGFVDTDESGRLYNAAALGVNGSLAGVYRKRHLPNYSVFDEERYFEPGPGGPVVFEVAGARVGVAICEDIWWPGGPLAGLAAAGADVAVVLNASPYFARRLEVREQTLKERAAEAGCPIVFVNQVGGQDELVFDGGSLAVGTDGRVRKALPQFDECVDTIELQDLHLPPPVPAAKRSVTSEVYDALVLGTRDYARKNGFTDSVFGLSGGIDSSLVACIASDALGPGHVHAVALPSRYTADESNDYAKRLATDLGLDFRTIPIEPAYQPMLDILAPSFAGMSVGLAEENLQGRIRSNLMWALSNKLGWLVLVCGNKSELAVGYTTAYGIDMAGGFAPIKDVWKTEVYALAHERNRRAGTDLIPQEVLDRPPSAELRPDQKDSDSLPAYEALDPILEAFVENDRTAAQLVEAGHDSEVVRRIVSMVDAAEWKRRQAPPGVRVSPKAFGRDRRMPITNRYSG